VLLAVPGVARADDRALLERHRPVYVHDARDRYPVVGVQGSPPASYGRAVTAPGGGRWLQYWRWHTVNPQDRGILRTGRHEGDWELVQVRVERGGRPVEAVYAQHSGAERCGWPTLRKQGDAPVAFLANGSHAAYFVPGIWPGAATSAASATAASSRRTAEPQARSGCSCSSASDGVAARSEQEGGAPRGRPGRRVARHPLSPPRGRAGGGRAGASYARAL